MDFAESARQAAHIRCKCVLTSHLSRCAHLGGCLSVVDILVAAYYHVMDRGKRGEHGDARDRLILSKGHAALALYATLTQLGEIPSAALLTVGSNGSALSEQPSPGALPGVEAATGSLGHGLGLGLGVVLGHRVRGIDAKVVVVMGDGECGEGSVWEAAQIAAEQAAKNLIAVVDCNKLRGTGKTPDHLSSPRLLQKFREFGWNSTLCDGHDIEELTKSMRLAERSHGSPLCVVALTEKGKGVKRWEGDNNWHYRVPTEEEVGAACDEIFAAAGIELAEPTARRPGRTGDI